MNRINTPVFRSLLNAVILILPLMLWLTRDGWYKSMSAFADAPNEVIYNSIHICIAMLFIAMGQAQKRDYDYLIAALAFAVLLTNMRDYLTLHIVATGALVGAVSWGMVKYSQHPHKLTNYFLAAMVPFFFLLGLGLGLHIFTAEYCIFLFVTVHIARRNFIGPGA